MEEADFATHYNQTGAGLVYGMRNGSTVAGHQHLAQVEVLFPDLGRQEG